MGGKTTNKTLVGPPRLWQQVVPGKIEGAGPRKIVPTHPQIKVTFQLLGGAAFTGRNMERIKKLNSNSTILPLKSTRIDSRRYMLYLNL